MVTHTSINALSVTTYLCWCGKTHDGEYALEDWSHHNCFHRDPLVLVHEDLPDYWICMICGQTFDTEPSS